MVRDIAYRDSIEETEKYLDRTIPNEKCEGKVIKITCADLKSGRRCHKKFLDVARYKNEFSHKVLDMDKIADDAATETDKEFQDEINNLMRKP